AHEVTIQCECEIAIVLEHLELALPVGIALLPISVIAGIRRQASHTETDLVEVSTECFSLLNARFRAEVRISPHQLDCIEPCACREITGVNEVAFAEQLRQYCRLHTSYFLAIILYLRCRI